MIKQGEELKWKEILEKQLDECVKDFQLIIVLHFSDTTGGGSAAACELTPGNFKKTPRCLCLLREGILERACDDRLSEEVRDIRTICRGWNIQTFHIVIELGWSIFLLT